MRLASVAVDGSSRIGLVDVDTATVAVLPATLGTLDDVVRRGADAVHALADSAGAADVRAIDSVSLLPPLRRLNRDVLCTGWNYWDHFEESAGKREGQDPVAAPLHPTFFTKGPDTIVGPHAAIAYDADLSLQWDYEAEVALVFGRDGRSIPTGSALDHVLGLCIANDVSLRDVQRRHGGQWLKGKSIDATMPIGPWITTLDEIPDLTDLVIECVLNGEVVQHARTAQMAFGFETLVAELSLGMTVRAGDLLLTGTPSGVGNARDPKLFLRPGDEILTRVSGLGELRNRIESVALAAAGSGPGAPHGA